MIKEGCDHLGYQCGKCRTFSTKNRLGLGTHFVFGTFDWQFQSNDMNEALCGLNDNTVVALEVQLNPWFKQNLHYDDLLCKKKQFLKFKLIAVPFSVYNWPFAICCWKFEGLTILELLVANFCLTL